MEVNSPPLKKTARIAGLLYLVWIITGLFAMFYVPSQINLKGDAATTARNILSNEFLFRASIVNDIFSAVIWMIMVLVFYRLFSKVSAFHSKLLAAFVFVQIPNIFFVNAFSIASLMILKGEVLGAYELVQRQEAALLLIKISESVIILLEAFWGLWLFPLAILVYKSGFLPRFLGVWLFITGFFYLLLSCVDILLPQHRDVLLKSVFALPIELGEVAFMLWILIMGAKEPKASAAP